MGNLRRGRQKPEETRGGAPGGAELGEGEDENVLVNHISCKDRAVWCGDENVLRGLVCNPTQADALDYALNRYEIRVGRYKGQHLADVPHEHLAWMATVKDWDEPLRTFVRVAYRARFGCRPDGSLRIGRSRIQLALDIIGLGEGFALSRAGRDVAQETRIRDVARELRACVIDATGVVEPRRIVSGGRLVRAAAKSIERKLAYRARTSKELNADLIEQGFKTKTIRKAYEQLGVGWVRYGGVVWRFLPRKFDEDAGTAGN